MVRRALSGALTSAFGYVLWYRVLQHLRAMTASTVQLSAPIIATLAVSFCWVRCSRAIYSSPRC